MKILYIAEIVRKAGVYCIKTKLKQLKQKFEVDFVIANADGATGGYGLGKNHSVYLHKLGINVLCTGENVYYKQDLHEQLKNAPYILRAANFPPGNPGRGWGIYSLKDGNKLAVINMMGQAGFKRTHASNPFRYLPDIVEKIKKETPHIVLDFHAATTAEKRTMAFLADGMISAVIGSHSRIQTADEQILPGGCAAITDAGRTGSSFSIGGMEVKTELEKILTQVPLRSKDAWEKLQIQGLFVETNNEGKAIKIERIREDCPRDVNSSAS